MFALVPFSAGDERHAQQSLFVYVGQAEDKKGEKGEGIGSIFVAHCFLGRVYALFLFRR